MSAKDETRSDALVPRPPSAVEKAEPGAKRVLALMVTETLVIAQQQLTPASMSPTKVELENWFQHGLKHFRGEEVPQNYEEAVRWFRKAAEQGHTEAQNYLGGCYFQGNGVRQDRAETVKWWRKAAERQGQAVVQNNLGVCYCHGCGVPQDHAEAAKWWRLAAEQGHAEAQRSLGACYYQGHGVPQDYGEAVKWFRKAAEQGYADAQYNLGGCYEHGLGVKADQIEAYKWIRLAEAQGHEGEAEEVVSVGALLSPKQIAEGERRCKEFKAHHRT